MADGTTESRNRLTSGLEAAGLRCITDMDAVASGMLRTNHLVDHVCLSSRHAHLARVSVWEAFDVEDVRLSDHPTLAVDVDLT